MKGKDILIAILFGLNIVLVVFMVLLLTGVVKVGEGVESANNGVSGAVDSNVDSNVLSSAQALDIVKEYYTVARDFFDLSAIAFCGKTEIGGSKIYNGVSYSKSSQFTSKQELDSYLDSYMTEDVKLSSIGYSSNDAYIEEDGHLYCTTNGKGSNMSYTEFDDSLSVYDIVEVKDTSISVNITAAYHDVDNQEVNKKNIKLVLTKNGSDRWLISSYEDLTNY